MKVDFSQILRNLAGQPITDGEHNLTLGLVAANALLAEDPAVATGAQKVERFNFAARLYASNGSDLTVQESALVQERIAAVYPTLIAGQAIKMIEASATGLREVAKA